MKRTAAALLMVLLGVGRAWGQCPDGTPPPCAARATPLRHADPPLDDRRWIVLPFDNTAHTSEVEWLRAGSVSLLYLDLAGWDEIHVVDDERVLDLVRKAPTGRAPGAMTLEAGLALARRTGAGHLVMGGLTQIGDRTRIVANVFQVRSGSELRSVQEYSPNADSLLAVYGRLAGQLLGLSPAALPSAVGTRSVAAVRGYAAGMEALKAWDMPAAEAGFREALKADSTFALAHFRLANVIGRDAPELIRTPARTTRDAERADRSSAAVRLSSGLPLRERTLIRANHAVVRDEWSGGCTALHALVRTDPGDVEAWYALGECAFLDPVARAVDGDSTTLRFRSNWNDAVTAHRQVLRLDPRYHMAYDRIQSTVSAPGRRGCWPLPGEDSCLAACARVGVERASAALAPVLSAAPCPAGHRFVAGWVDWVGDSILVSGVRPGFDVPARRPTGGPAGAPQSAATVAEKRRLALRFAREWVEAGPGESRANEAVEEAFFALAEYDSAAVYLRRVRQPDVNSLAGLIILDRRANVAVLTGRSADAIAVLDSAAAVARPITRRSLANKLAAFGRFGVLASLSAGDEIGQYRVLVARQLAGLEIDGIEAIEARLLRPGTSEADLRRRTQAADLIRTALVLGPPRSRTVFPRPDTATGGGSPQRVAAELNERVAGTTQESTPVERWQRLVTAVIGENRAEARRELAAFDSLLGRAVNPGDPFVSARAHLTMLDSAGAMQRMEADLRAQWGNVLDRSMSPGICCNGWFRGRELLLLGDVARHLKQWEVALRAYSSLLDFWQGADEELQPTVRRVRLLVDAIRGM